MATNKSIAQSKVSRHTGVLIYKNIKETLNDILTSTNSIRQMYGFLHSMS